MTEPDAHSLPLGHCVNDGCRAEVLYLRTPALTCPWGATPQAAKDCRSSVYTPNSTTSQLCQQEHGEEIPSTPPATWPLSDRVGCLTVSFSKKMTPLPPPPTQQPPPASMSKLEGHTEKRCFCPCLHCRWLGSHGISLYYFFQYVEGIVARFSYLRCLTDPARRYTWQHIRTIDRFLAEKAQGGRYDIFGHDVLLARFS